MIFAAQQILQIRQLCLFKTVEVSLKKALQNKVEFQQGASACPTDTPFLGRHTARCTIMSLILPIARVGFSPLGQTSTQFMIEWQRNSRYGSSRLSRRSLVA